jgi:hypothetical protein
MLEDGLINSIFQQIKREFKKENNFYPNYPH